MESLAVVVINSILVTGDPAQHGEPWGRRHQQQSCHRGRRCPAHTAPQLDPENHEKIKWPPLLALKRVARWTLAILGQAKRSWKRSWKAQQGGAQDLGGRARGLGYLGFCLRRSIVNLVVTVTFSSLCQFGFWFMPHFYFLWAIHQHLPVVISTWSGPDGRNMLCRKENKLSK